MKQLKRITVDRIMSWCPCSAWPRERVEEAFAGRRSLTPLEVSALGLPAPDILWVLLREEVLSARELRLVECLCAERALKSERKSGREPDARSWEAVRVSRQFALGRATTEELSVAEGAAWSAARSAARNAAWSAAESAARGAAWSAAWSSVLAHVRRVLRRIA